ncbi:hypothetical protein SNE40_009059 [Patella caerulea]|uniref:Uncharacterized protein n=1 Tax=Patella caerulea TaxID=87958 RepID=A0AAN8JT84_PATCE
MNIARITEESTAEELLPNSTPQVNTTHQYNLPEQDTAEQLLPNCSNSTPQVNTTHQYNLPHQDTAEQLLPNCSNSTPQVNTTHQYNLPHQDTAEQLLPNCSNSTPQVNTTHQYNLAARLVQSVVSQNITDGDNSSHDDIVLNDNITQRAQNQTVTEPSEEHPEEYTEIWLKSTLQEFKGQ